MQLHVDLYISTLKALYLFDLRSQPRVLRPELADQPLLLAPGRGQPARLVHELPAQRRHLLLEVGDVQLRHLLRPRQDALMLRSLRLQQLRGQEQGVERCIIDNRALFISMVYGGLHLAAICCAISLSIPEDTAEVQYLCAATDISLQAL